MAELSDFLSLIEAARDLKTDVEHLIRCAARGELAVFVIADNWTVQGEDNDPSTDLTGHVYLTEDDLLQGVGADFTPVRQVRAPDTEDIVTLTTPQEILRGDLYATVDELDKFRRQHGVRLELDSDAAPYLNPHHDWYSEELATAVEAWMAVFADIEFEPRKKSPKYYVERWLSKNRPKLPDNAKARIATLVNPTDAKKGGAPSTSLQ